MGFKENIKAELAYKDMLVKELSALSGVNKRTIDNYLREDGSMPSAEAAVAIAGVLGVSVENLITGYDDRRERSFTPIFSEPQAILKLMESLNKRDRNIVLTLAKSLKKMENLEKKS
jgi:transcriptional regulator with XRE-family HTH domain